MSPSVRAIERYIAVPGGEIYCKIWRPSSGASGAPVVLLHDSLGCVELWRDFPERLAELTGRVVIAYDRLGFGRSSVRNEIPTSRFIHEEAELYFPRVAEAIQLNRFVLLGHSVGGGMAILIAGAFPGRCEGVISEAAQAFVEERTLEGIRKAKAGFAAPEGLARLEKYHGNKAHWVLRAWADRWLAQEFSDWSLAADLPKVTCPMLVIHGDRDEYGSLRFPEMICSLAGGEAEKLIVPDCGHVPHREKLAEVFAAIQRFLQAL